MYDGRKMSEFRFPRWCSWSLRSCWAIGRLCDWSVECPNRNHWTVFPGRRDFICFFETSGTNQLVMRRHTSEVRRAQVRTHEWEKGVGCTKMVNREVKDIGAARMREREEGVNKFPY